MSGPVLLLAHSLRRIRTVLIAMAVLLGAFQIMLVLMARSIDQNGGFRQLAAMMPPFMRDMMGPSVTVFLSFSGMVCLGYFHLAVMGSLIGISIAIATTPTGEIETGFIDLLLARPVPRHWLISRTIAVAVLASAALVGVMMMATWLGLATLAPPDAEWPSERLVRSMGLNLWLLVLCWSGIALAIGAASRRRTVAGGISGLLALATFLADYLGRMWEPANSVAWLSPFRYFNAFDLVKSETIPAKDIAVLIGVTLVGFTAAYVAFARRDISH